MVLYLLNPRKKATRKKATKKKATKKKVVRRKKRTSAGGSMRRNPPKKRATKRRRSTGGQKMARRTKRRRSSKKRKRTRARKNPIRRRRKAPVRRRRRKAVRRRRPVARRRKVRRNPKRRRRTRAVVRRRRKAPKRRRAIARRKTRRNPAKRRRRSAARRVGGWSKKHFKLKNLLPNRKELMSVGGIVVGMGAGWAGTVAATKLLDRVVTPALDKMGVPAWGEGPTRFIVWQGINVVLAFGVAGIGGYVTGNAKVRDRMLAGGMFRILWNVADMYLPAAAKYWGLRGGPDVGDWITTADMAGAPPQMGDWITADAMNRAVNA